MGFGFGLGRGNEGMHSDGVEQGRDVGNDTQ